MKKFLISLIKKYQKNISKTKPYGASCRFTPTCSQYAVEALDEWGVFIGLILSFLRILRCNPLFKGGYDPVPKRKSKIKKQKSTKKN